MTQSTDLVRNRVSLEEISAFLYREARLADDQAWDEWLGCYAPDVEYWVPAWTDDGELTRDPRSQISLIYYRNRQGLEDRVYRLRTGLSTASNPAPRTSHNLSNVELIGQEGDVFEVRYNWQTLSHRLQDTSVYFGTSMCKIDMSGPKPQIRKKTVILKNDYVHQVLDFYHI